MKTSVCALCCLVLVAGCRTQLEVSRDPAATTRPNDATAGIEYSLPMLQYRLSVVRTLVQCVDDSKQVKIRFLTKVEAEPHYVAGERFVIDYRGLSGWSKVTGMELQTYDNGVIKSLNASADDQSAAIIGDVVKSGVSLMSLSTGVPGIKASGPDKGLPPGGNLLACTPGTLTLLDQIATLKSALETQTQALQAATASVAHLEALAVQNALTEEAKARLEEARTRVRERAAAVEAADKDLARRLEQVSVKDQVIWPRKVGEHRLDAAPGPSNSKKLEGLFAASKTGVTHDELKQSFRVVGVLAPTVNAGAPGAPEPRAAPPVAAPLGTCKPCDGSSDPPAKAFKGLVYRSPVPAQLLVCQVADALDCTPGSASAVQVSAGVMAPQLGALRMLPLSNGAFQNNVLAVAFRENGGIAKFNYDEKAARGKALSGAVASGLGSAIAYRDARRAYEDEQAKQKQQAALDELDAQIARLEKQKKIDELTLAPSTDPESTAYAQTETVRLEAQLALLEARRKLREAEAAGAVGGAQ